MRKPHPWFSLRIGVIATLAAIASVAVPAAASAGQGGKKGLSAELRQIVRDPQGPPGASVLIRRGKHSRYLTSGVANLNSGRAPVRGLRMRIASMSKALNGAVALALVSEGKLRLGDTIDDLLPGVWPLAGGVTLRQMLRHTGGLPEYIHSPEFIDTLNEDPTQYLTPLELLDFVDDQPPDFDPGTAYEYSDTDNIVVGLMAEAASDRSYDSLLRRYVYRPAGMTHTTFPRTIAMPRPYLRGYEVPESGAPEDVSELINPALAGASGGIVSNAGDVGRFFRAYVGGDLFKASAIRGRRRFVTGSSSPPGPGANGSGFGLFRYKTRCGRVFGHTGSFPGYRQFAAASRDGKRSIVFTVNAQIVPGQGSQHVSERIRNAQVRAVCRILN